jgi:hypothetical protein
LEENVKLSEQWRELELRIVVHLALELGEWKGKKTLADAVVVGLLEEDNSMKDKIKEFGKRRKKGRQAL